MRKMATIRKIDDIQPIEGADLIHTVKIGGWTVVAQKEMNYKVGDLVVYCEIDSFIPDSVAPFLTQPGKFPKEYNGVKGERLKTKKLKGVISQGLLLPLYVLECEHEGNIGLGDYQEGDDVSEDLNIQKWEAPEEFKSADSKGNFPHFLRKTDQERCQNIARTIKDQHDLMYTFEVTEKLDGSSMTVFIKDGIVGVCSRNLELKEDVNNTFWKVAIESGVVDLLKKKYDNMLNPDCIAFQGELIGPGIQGNKYNLSKHEFYVYDVFNIDNQEYYLPLVAQGITVHYGLNYVPVIDKNHIPADNISDMLVQAEGKSVLNPKTEREGLVFKGNTEDVSWKAISNKWLLKNE